MLVLWQNGSNLLTSHTSLSRRVGGRWWWWWWRGGEEEEEEVVQTLC